MFREAAIPASTVPGRCFVRFLVMLILACASSAGAGEPSAPRRGVLTPPIASAEEDECLGVPNCVGQRSDVTLLKGGQQRAITVACGGERPYAWQVDSRHHGHIQWSLEQIQLSVEQRAPTGVTVLARNLATIPGTLMILLGCSSEPFDAAARRPLAARARFQAKLEWPPDGDVCAAWGTSVIGSPEVPQCISAGEFPGTATFDHFLQSKTVTYSCPDAYPFYAPTHYLPILEPGNEHDTCFSCIDNSAGGVVFAAELSCTLWCPGPRTLSVRMACSQIPFNKDCNQKVPDPNWGRRNQRTVCRDGAIPSCITVWDEVGTQFFPFPAPVVSCFADQNGTFCTGCP